MSSSSGQEEMQINPTRAKHLSSNLNHVLSQIKSANTAGQNVRLIAVSKLKPANDILALHNAPTSHSHFGENYSQELMEKAALLPKTINWHFIGALQTNKCRPLAETIPNLFSVSSVDSSKKADGLEKGRAKLVAEKGEEIQEGKKLRVLVQVNTSGEEEKSGVEPKDAVTLCKHIIDNCPHLELGGLMTIGAIARSKATTKETENEDFEALRKCRDGVAQQLGMDADKLELSMGMSSDFEAAIRQGSTEVRVGTTIFGERPARGDAKVKEDTTEEKK
ncbi:hypothetical protein QM012_006331 [Aureobasidium pullulans]|uniref:Pyridoxal phosphate homeostasis protein n=1 Tax=Aureobasidium pullulans TaxID=5580 RepID=A0ABR0TS92_AURPU